MRNILNLNFRWAFSKQAEEVPAEMPKMWDVISLPHSWNAVDGQDGGNDYYRGTAYYAKTFHKMDLPEAKKYFLEIRGANSSATVYLNGQELATHHGGYSTWRVDLTEAMNDMDNLLVIAVNNEENDFVYPQMADFTFYGGLYRDVNLICVDESHFDLEFWGSNGIKVTPEDHELDMELIYEVGANTIRLAHYQHDQYFYDLCDRYGMVVWAEIPYISKHMSTGRENTITQMKELVTQNYHHPSIVVWGLSNEIGIGGSDKDLLKNHRILNDLCHEMDPTRKTVIAAVSMCSIDDPYLQIPDVVSYNHYFGWYGGETDMNGPWFDNFHKKHPNIPIGCSEYGCEALDWHTSKPVQGDYTEEYQAYYHEELIKQFFSRKYIWATHVWNMFDFGADARNEGGENGLNHKGLMTMDRKYKKDSFYAYKAWLSDEPFVHICGKRYVDRVEDVTKVTVYSNLPEVELFANGESLGKIAAEDHFFYFEVPNKGETVLKAVAGQCTDESFLRKVVVFNEAYRLKEKGAILNWFDITEVDGYFSLNDKISDIMATVKGKLLFMTMMAKMMPKKDEKKEAAGFDLSQMDIEGGLMQMMGGFTVLRLSGMMGMMGVNPTKEQLLDLNAKLNKIKKPNKK